MEYGQQGIEKSGVDLDSWQSTSVLQGVRFSSLGLPSCETDFTICAPRDHYRQEGETTIRVRNFSEFNQGHRGTIDHNQSFRKGTLILDKFGYIASQEHQPASNLQRLEHYSLDIEKPTDNAE